MKKVLIVEDNPVNRELLREILLLHDYEAIEAHNGEEALLRLAESHLDLVLLDVNMPRMDGFAVIARIRDNPKLFGLPVIAVTGCAMKDERDKVLAAGFDCHLTKPFDAKDLLAEMRRLIKQEPVSVCVPILLPGGPINPAA